MRLENTLVSTRNIRKGDLTSSANTSQGQRSLQPPLEADVCLLVVARKFFPPPSPFLSYSWRTVVKTQTVTTEELKRRSADTSRLRRSFSVKRRRSVWPLLARRPQPSRPAWS